MKMMFEIEGELVNMHQTLDGIKEGNDTSSKGAEILEGYETDLLA